MTKLLFSLPVHERPDIVRDQIDNINYFCPGATVCVHVSEAALADKDDFRRHCDLENVLINPRSYETGWCEGLMHVHVSNFIHALESGVDFDKIVLISSNELFVKPGFAQYASGYSMGTQMEIYDQANDWGFFRTEYIESPIVQRFLKVVGFPLYVGGQAEGQFYDKEIFSYMAKIFVSCFPMGPFAFPTEEIIPPTIAAYYAMMGMDATLPITLCNYSNNLEITEDLIGRVREGTGSVFVRRKHRCLRSPHIGSSVLNGVFAVKRIPREDCDMRRFIRSLMV